MSAFDDFAIVAAELFGMDAQEAANLLDELEDRGFDLYEDDLRDEEWATMATDYLDSVLDLDDPQYDWMDFDLDDSWEAGDDWVDAGDIYEVTAEYEEK